MLDLLLPRPAPSARDPGLADSLARAAASLARLDQAAAGHPLAPALLYRTRLEAVRRQAAADGMAIDPWHLAAVLEGLRFRMDHALRLVDRGVIFDAARHALDQHHWLVTPDFDQEGEVRTAERTLQAQAGTPLLAAAAGIRQWIDGNGPPGADGARPPLRSALVRFWVRQRVLRLPVPLTGARALQADAPWAEAQVWVPMFLTALADEADDALDLLLTLERTWFAARRVVGDRRRQSRAGAAIDILAAAPLVSATSLAAGLGMAVKNAAALLDEFRHTGIAVEVTHRSKRRLFGLAGLAPLREVVRPPDRPDPTRGRGRPRRNQFDDPAESVVLPVPPASLTPLDRRQFDYSDLEQWMVHMDQTIRHTRRALSALAPVTRPKLDVSGEPSDSRSSPPNRLFPTPIQH